LQWFHAVRVEKHSAEGIELSTRGVISLPALATTVQGYTGIGSLLWDGQPPCFLCVIAPMPFVERSPRALYG